MISSGEGVRGANGAGLAPPASVSIGDFEVSFAPPERNNGLGARWHKFEKRPSWTSFAGLFKAPRVRTFGGFTALGLPGGRHIYFGSSAFRTGDALVVGGDLDTVAAFVSRVQNAALPAGGERFTAQETARQITHYDADRCPFGQAGGILALPHRAGRLFWIELFPDDTLVPRALPQGFWQRELDAFAREGAGQVSRLLRQDYYNAAAITYKDVAAALRGVVHDAGGPAARRWLSVLDRSVLPTSIEPLGIESVEVSTMRKPDGNLDIVLRLRHVRYDESAGLAAPQSTAMSEWTGSLPSLATSSGENEIVWQMSSAGADWHHRVLQTGPAIISSLFRNRTALRFPDPYEGYERVVAQNGEEIRYRHDGNRVQVVGSRHAVAALVHLLLKSEAEREKRTFSPFTGVPADTHELVLGNHEIGDIRWKTCLDWQGLLEVEISEAGDWRNSVELFKRRRERAIEFPVMSRELPVGIVDLGLTLYCELLRSPELGSQARDILTKLVRHPSDFSRLLAVDQRQRAASLSVDGSYVHRAFAGVRLSPSGALSSIDVTLIESFPGRGSSVNVRRLVGKTNDGKRIYWRERSSNPLPEGSSTRRDSSIATMQRLFAGGVVHEPSAVLPPDPAEEQELADIAAAQEGVAYDSFSPPVTGLRV